MLPVMERILLCSFINLLSLAGISAQETQRDSCIILSPEDFYLQLYDAGYPLLLDTRSRREFRKERIEGALLAENRVKLDHICDTLDLDREIFIYCEHDYRSLKACETLIGKGFRNVHILQGGVRAWESSSYDIDRAKIQRRKNQD
jgi:rhodanese-related sulfurtransferase